MAQRVEGGEDLTSEGGGDQRMRRTSGGITQQTYALPCDRGNPKTGVPSIAWALCHGQAAKSITGSSQEAASGRERVSATTLSLPLMCWMSLMNSAMNDRWLACLGERLAALASAYVSGL